MRLPTPATAPRMPASVRLPGRSPRPGYPGFVVEEKSADQGGAARGSVRGPGRLRARASALVLVLAVAGCAQSPSDPAADKDAAHSASPSVVSAPTSLTGAGEFKRRTTAAIVYNRKLVPKGAQASLTAESTGGKTVTSLVVEGLLPDHRYGAHLHVAPCGARPADAGAHFQHVAGRADASSEVWLDLKTDNSGAGRATAHHDWPLAGALPRSLVLHASATAPSAPPAPRIACLTLS
ncbi:hypothetical protein [Nonomuraea guangzhouensis]|uniref:Superoxide dismutase family protein n=2 Tax=Nonomuraea guangzhouensis TaxID=1291555 RepID=A0ABW4G1Q8_9ACTN|nr:hypothetical protein [Nonomuraea guangzhouensis]